MAASSASSAKPASARAACVSSLPKIAGEKASGFLKLACWPTAGQRRFSRSWSCCATIFGLRVKEAADASRRRVLDRLAALSVSEQTSFILLEFLGLADPRQATIKLDPKARKALLLDFVENACRVPALADATTVVLIEDLHWIDAASEEFVEALADAVVGTTTLLGRQFQTGICRTPDAAHALSANQHAAAAAGAGRDLAAGSFWQGPFAGIAEPEHHRARAGKSVLPRGA